MKRNELIYIAGRNAGGCQPRFCAFLRYIDFGRIYYIPLVNSIYSSSFSEFRIITVNYDPKLTFSLIPISEALAEKKIQQAYCTDKPLHDDDAFRRLDEMLKRAKIAYRDFNKSELIEHLMYFRSKITDSEAAEISGIK